ncbi:MAG: flavodoxin [Oscillospiraceae bacterium]|nr:flavodoxin [Oscillospiraceae bacterium]
MQIYYFTRSGRSKAIAEQLAAQYETTARRIDDHKNWQGKLNYLKAAFAAMRGKLLPIDYQKPDVNDGIAVVCPLWAGGLPPAVKTFAHEIGKEKLICVVTSLGSTLTNRDGFAKVIDLVGDAITPPTAL